MGEMSEPRYRRSLDQHFRVLTPREQELVRRTRAQASAFLLYDALEGVRRTLQAARLDRSGAVYIGRADDNDIAVGWEQSVSGTHAKIEREATVWFLEDLDSKNGTFVGRERLLDRRRLRDGDMFSLSRGANAARFEFNCAEPLERTVTRHQSASSLTSSQLRLLSALCVHRLYGCGVEPATDEEMARVLRMAPTSMRSGLTPIYRACGLEHVPHSSKRRQLAEFAIERGLARRDHLGVDAAEIFRRLAESGGRPAQRV
jgi:pSer/pThr/pTyr-binding forkhead associated (FHA) protein